MPLQTFTFQSLSSRISRYRQLIYSRANVQLLWLIGYWTADEQIFVVEEIFDHHSISEHEMSLIQGVTMFTFYLSFF